MSCNIFFFKFQNSIYSIPSTFRQKTQPLFKTHVFIEATFSPKQNPSVLSETQSKLASRQIKTQPLFSHHHHHYQMNGGVDVRRDGGDEDDSGEGFKQEMRDLEEMMSKLNPMAEEFVPPSLANYRPLLQHSAPVAPHFGYITDNNYVINTNSPANGNSTRRTFSQLYKAPLSGKPFASVLISKSHLHPSYLLRMPTKLHRLLPSVVVPAFLSYRGKTWEMFYYGDVCNKRLDTEWKTFAIDNDLNIGDACVFELTECSPTKLKFKVQILRGDFPDELLAKSSPV